MDQRFLSYVAPMADMARLIREEQARIFGPQIEEIKDTIKELDDGLILPSEALSTINTILGRNG